MAEVLELAGCAAIENCKRRVSPRHILLVIRNDEEFDELLKDVVIPRGGVVQHIPPFLLLPTTKGGSDPIPTPVMHISNNKKGSKSWPG